MTRAVNKLLILGGTGFVGRALCARWLARAGASRVTVPTRSLMRAQRLPTSLPGLTLVEADVHDPVRLARLVEGHDAVVNLVAILHGSTAEFHRAHVELPRTLTTACRTAGVRRVVHVSALGVGSGSSASADAPSRYLRSKAEGESVLTDAGLDLTILRPSVIYGADDHFLNLFARLQKFAPLVPLACAEALFQPVWVEDVAAGIVACLEQPVTTGQIFECAGPDVFPLAELVRLAGRWSGHPRLVVPLPAGVGRLQAALMAHLPGEPLMSPDNLDSMRTPNVASGRLPTLTDLGIAPARLESVAPGYLSIEPKR